jgi:beta-fructofuranosidase
MHATSPDLNKWTKDPGCVLEPDSKLGYVLGAWRDPFVFWNKEAGEYWCLVCAGLSGSNRGCLGLMASKDLKTWQARKPLWEHEQYWGNECPDLFKMGDWYYLIFSCAGEEWFTRYRMSKSLSGPWQSAPDDLFDAGGYYAAKTMSDGNKRYLAGWMADKVGRTDNGKWLWGGCLLVHELVQRPDGTLGVKIPEGLAGAFKNDVALQAGKKTGEWQGEGGEFACASPGRMSILTLGAMPDPCLPDPCLIEATVTLKRGTAEAGVLLRTEQNLNDFYSVRIHPGRQRLILDRRNSGLNDRFAMERPLEIKPGRSVHLRIVVSGSVATVYADGQVALTGRVYNRREGALALYVTEGQASFSDVKIKKLEEKK